MKSVKLDVFASPSPPRSGLVMDARPVPRAVGHLDMPPESSLRRPSRLREAEESPERSKRLRLVVQADAESAAPKAIERLFTPCADDADTGGYDSVSSLDHTTGLLQPSSKDEMGTIDEGTTVNTTLLDADPFADLRAMSPAVVDHPRSITCAKEGVGQVDCGHGAARQADAGEEPTSEEDDFDAWLEANVLVV